MGVSSRIGSGLQPGVCLSTDRPDDPFEGQVIYETDTNRTLVWDNAAWLVLSDRQVLAVDSANTRVGIGTTAPIAHLDVRGQVVAHGSTGTNTTTQVGAITINNNSADNTVDFTQGIVFTDNVNGSGPWTHAGIVAVGSSGFNGSLVFGTDGDSTNNTTGITERMRIDASGVIRSNTAAVFTPLTTPQVYEFGSTGASGGPVSLTGLPTTTRAIIANVFVTSASDDHFNTNFKGGSSIANYQNWVNTPGAQPSTIFGNLAATNAMGALHTYYGQLDGFTSNYGIWQQLVIPMYGSRNLYWNSYGASSTQRWYYVQVIAYADGV